MSGRSLADNDIYAIPVGDFWNVEQERLHILYSPLSGHIMLADNEEIEKLEEICSDLRVGTDAQDGLLRQMKESRGLFVYGIPKAPEEICEVDILPNFTCNFSCTYCYSAAGRSSQQVSMEHVRAVIDHLFSRRTPLRRPYKINFSGGGEPLLSFPTIRETVEYVEEKARDGAFRYSYDLVTNGSLLTPEIIGFIKEQKINLVVSFEILKEFQNMERGNYDQVARNIDLLLEMECPFGIRATITPLSVGHMGEMVRELSRRFPQLGAVVFDTVLSAGIFKTPEQLSAYYRDFSDEYWRAKELGGEMGIKVRCNAVEFADMLRERNCQGKIVLTPEGMISSCARISSPKETLYDGFIYGRADGGKLEMDGAKLAAAMNRNNIHTRGECRRCYARWNCGGGCMLFSLSFPLEFEEPFCEFTRGALKRTLFEMLSRKHSETHHGSLRDWVNDFLSSSKNGA